MGSLVINILRSTLPYKLSEVRSGRLSSVWPVKLASTERCKLRNIGKRLSKKHHLFAQPCSWCDHCAEPYSLESCKFNSCNEYRHDICSQCICYERCDQCNQHYFYCDLCIIARTRSVKRAKVICDSCAKQELFCEICAQNVCIGSRESCERYGREFFQIVASTVTVFVRCARMGVGRQRVIDCLSKNVAFKCSLLGMRKWCTDTIASLLLRNMSH